MQDLFFSCKQSGQNNKILFSYPRKNFFHSDSVTDYFISIIKYLNIWKAVCKTEYCIKRIVLDFRHSVDFNWTKILKKSLYLPWFV